MSPPRAAQEEWDRLVAERAAARARLARSLDLLAVRAKDPLRLKETIRRHPIVAAGLAAGAGALLVRLLLRGPAREEEKAARVERTPEDDAPSIFDALRDAAIRAAAPYVARFVDEHLGGAPDSRDGEAAPADRRRATARGDGVHDEA